MRTIAIIAAIVAVSAPAFAQESPARLYVSDEMLTSIQNRIADLKKVEETGKIVVPVETARELCKERRDERLAARHAPAMILIFRGYLVGGPGYTPYALNDAMGAMSQQMSANNLCISSMMTADQRAAERKRLEDLLEVLIEEKQK